MSNGEKVLPPVCPWCGCEQGGPHILVKNAGPCNGIRVVHYQTSIHPNRLKAENLVPASELDELIKVLERVMVNTCHAHGLPKNIESVANQAIAHAKTVLGGK